MPDVLRQVLKAAGFDAEAVMRMWRDREWLMIDPHSGKARHRARIGRKNAWLVAIRRQAVELVLQAGTDVGECREQT